MLVYRIISLFAIAQLLSATLAAAAHDHHQSPTAVVNLIRSKQSGPWSKTGTWEGDKVPQKGNSVLIAEGHRVEYDIESRDVFRAIHVSGELRFTRKGSTRLEAGLIKIAPGNDVSEEGFDCEHLAEVEARPQAALVVGTSAEPIPAEFQALIRLHHLDGMNPETCPAIVCCGGRMEFHGARLANTWTKLHRTAKAGEPTVEARGDLAGWRVNDRIILAGTHHPDGAPQTPSLVEGSQTEERLIVSLRQIEDDVWSIKLDKPLAFEHFAEGDFRGEVANLSRNVVVESANPAGVRAHTMYHQYSTGSISYAEFRHLGKRDVLGKYALHFHLCQDSMRGSSVIGASIWDSHNRWLTIHGTEYLVVRDCVGYKSIGHGYFLEDATETRNILDHNLACLVLPGKPLPKQVLPFDGNKGAGFWWANSLNSFTRNVAAECSEYGYQFECRKTAEFDPNCPVLQANGARKPVDVRVLPFVRFEDNEGHSLPFFGINLRGLNRPESGVINFASANKELADEAMKAIPAGDQPLHLRRTRFWDTRWPFHAGTTGVFVDGLDVYRSTYGLWRTVTDRHTYKGLSFREIGHRDIHMPLSIGIPDDETNRGGGQGAYYAGIGGFYDEQPPATVITHIRREGNQLIVRGACADSSAIKRVTVNERRAHSARGEFAEWEVALDVPVQPELQIIATAEDIAGHVEQYPHRLKYVVQD